MRHKDVLPNFIAACILIIFAMACPLSKHGYLYAYDAGFEEKINSLKWVAYSPTKFNPETGQYPSEISIGDDIATLAGYGFTGIVTYSSEGGLAKIPKISREKGMRGVICGIWNISSQAELDNAIKSREYVDAYCVGNEGINDGRYGIEDVKKSIEYVKSETGRPATTSEEIRHYSKQSIIGLGDWVFPNIHPVLYNVKSPDKAVQWISNHYNIVKRSASLANKTVFFKEVGFPTDGDELCNENKQKEFFELMDKTGIRFVYFEAFDQPWKDHLPFEPYWGLFNARRQPKEYIKAAKSFYF